MSEPFIAEIRIFPYNYAPRNWARCDGQLMQVSQNPTLFSLIGATYGGDGRTTFGVPNMECRAPMHTGSGIAPGLSFHQLGELAGFPYITLQETQMPSHQHTLRGDTTPSTNEPTGNIYGFSAFRGTTNNDAFIDVDPDTQLSEDALGVASGGGGAHENQQPYLGMPFCIALDGLYPPRN